MSSGSVTAWMRWSSIIAWTRSFARKIDWKTPAGKPAANTFDRWGALRHDSRHAS
jgi:hypothetical protein